MTQRVPAIYLADVKVICALLDSASVGQPDAADLLMRMRITSNTWNAFMGETNIGRRRMVDHLRRTRLSLLTSESAVSAPAPRERLRGRLLAYDPDASLSDGAAMAATAGFYSFDNAPPSILWLDYVFEEVRQAEAWRPFAAYVLCWVPDEFVTRANAGIEVNVEECLRWV